MATGDLPPEAEHKELISNVHARYRQKRVELYLHVHTCRLIHETRN
jgi:hypothetical protein